MASAELHELRRMRRELKKARANSFGAFFNLFIVAPIVLIGLALLAFIILMTVFDPEDMAQPGAVSDRRETSP